MLRKRCLRAISVGNSSVPGGRDVVGFPTPSEGSQRCETASRTSTCRHVSVDLVRMWILRVEGQARGTASLTASRWRMRSCRAAGHAWSSRAVEQRPGSRAPPRRVHGQNSQRTEQEREQGAWKAVPDCDAEFTCRWARWARPTGSQGTVFAELVAEGFIVHRAC